jgi:hypothetical protein
MTIALDTNDDSYICQGDIQVTLTFVEHELICDMLHKALDMCDFAYPCGIYDLPMDSEIVQRRTIIENLREQFNVLWSDRFTPFNENEIL